MLWVSAPLGCDSASLRERFATFTNNVVGMRPIGCVETSGIQLPIDEETSAERKLQLHRRENLKPPHEDCLLEYDAGQASS